VFGGTTIQQQGQFLDMHIHQNRYNKQVSSILNILVPVILPAL